MQYTEISLKEKMKEVICDRLGVDPEEIQPYSFMIDDLGADSLDTVELALAYEEELDIEIPVEHEPEYTARTFDIAFRYLANRLAENGDYAGKPPKLHEVHEESD